MENETKTAAEALIEARQVISSIESDNLQLATSLPSRLRSFSDEELQRLVDELGLLQKHEQGTAISGLCSALGVLVYGESCRRELAEKCEALNEQYVRPAQ